MKIALVVVAVLIVAAGMELVLETARHSAIPSTATVTASTGASATGATAAPNHSATPSPTPNVPTPPPPPTVTISGAGSGHSRVFALNDTTGYLARYTLGSSCQYDGHLRLTDDSYDNADFITETGPTSATRILNNVPIGNFYVAMTTTGRGCSWSVIFTPR